MTQGDNAGVIQGDNAGIVQGDTHEFTSENAYIDTESDSDICLSSFLPIGTNVHDIERLIVIDNNNRKYHSSLKPL